MSKNIRFNAFEMNCIAHQSPGLWRHPLDRSTEYKELFSQSAYYETYKAIQKHKN